MPYPWELNYATPTATPAPTPTPEASPEAPKPWEQDYAPTPLPYYQYKGGVPPPLTEDEKQAIQQALYQQALGLVTAPPQEEQALEPVPGTQFAGRLVNALKGAMAYGAGAPAEKVTPMISPEYDLGRQAAEAQTPAEFYRAAIPLGTEGAMLAASVIPGSGEWGAAGVRAPMRPPVQMGPPMVVPDPFAPTAAQQAPLAAAIQQAQQTRMQQVLARQAAAQAQPPPPQAPLEGPAPAAWNPAAAAQWTQQMQGYAAQLQQQARFEQQAFGTTTKVTADEIQKTNQQLARGYPAPPETRFVIQTTGEQPGVQYAPTVTTTGKVPKLAVRPPMAPGAPLPTAVAQPPQVQGAAGRGPRPIPVPPEDIPYSGQQPGTPPVPAAPRVSKPEVVPRPRSAADAAAASLEATNPKIGENVINKVLYLNGALDDVEGAVLMRELQRRSDEYDRAVDAVNATRDGSAEQAVAMSRLTEATDRFQDAVDASYKSGTAGGRGLAFRAGIDRFSLARMMREMQANNAGRRLDNLPDVVNRVRELSGKIGDVKNRMAMHAELSERMDAILKDYATKKAAAKAGGPRAPRVSTPTFLSGAATRAMERIARRRAEGRLYAGFDPEALMDHAIVGADIMARGVKDFTRWSTEMVSKVGDSIRPFLKQIYDSSRKLLEATMTTDRKLASYKTRKRADIDKLRAKIESGDFTRPQKVKLALDREALDLQKEYNGLRDQWKKELLTRQRAAMPGWRKTFDGLVEYLRAIKLTGVGTLGKIASAAVVRPAQSLAEDVAVQPWMTIPYIRRIAEGAPTENPMLSSYRGYLPATWQGIREIPSVLRGEHEPPEYSARGPDVFQYPGRVHGAGKVAIKTGEAELGRDRATKWAEKEGLNPSDPDTAAMINEYSNQRGMRGIWMNDNTASRGFRQILAMLERNLGAPGFIASRLARIFLPIVRVPTNVGIEAMRYHFGLPNAFGRIGLAIYNGIENVSPAQKDIIMMNLKKGQIGAALFVLGATALKNQLGGFYNKQTYKQTELKTGLRPMETKFLPQWMGAWASHNQPMLALHAGATFGHIMDSKYGNTWDAERGAVGGILGDIPFLNELGNVDKMLMGEPWESQKQMGGFLRGNIAPVLLQEISRWTDTHDKNGHPIKRYPRSVGEEIKLGIPGLREEVPAYRSHR